MPSGNKGEWSEVYVLFKLLAEGKLYAADSHLTKIQDIFFPVIRILREEAKKTNEYIVEGSIKIIDATSREQLAEIPKSEFLEKSKQLLKILQAKQSRAFSLPDIESFLSSIGCKKLKTKSTDKSDIVLMVHDSNTGLNPTLGFSIKSMLGNKSTLLNAGKTTNFIYKLTADKNTNINVREVNNIKEEPKIRKRLEYLAAKGFKIKYETVQSSTFKRNLQLIDSLLPEILSYLLLYRYTEDSNDNLTTLMDILIKKNPLKFESEEKHPFYEYKIRNFLTDVALGMTPGRIWGGKYDATGGIIIVKSDGDIVCYHTYNRNEFQDYLIKNTRLEQASTSRYEFGNIYKMDGKLFINLNLQIRFK